MAHQHSGLSDRDIAVRILALEEEPPSVEEFEEWLQSWDSRFDEFLASEHRGDCTKEPFSCARCIAEGVLRLAQIYRHAFSLAD